MKKNTHAFTFFLTQIILLFCLGSNAQSIDYIRSSGAYYFGTGTGNNYPEARRNALGELSESISVQIKSSFEQVVIDTGDDIETYTESVINTYSDALINNPQLRVMKEERGQVEVLAYISKAEMQAAYRQREQMIHDFVLLANTAREEIRIADALRYNYWALVLARTHPDNTRLRYHFGGDQELPLMLTLNDRISRIFSFLKVEIASVKEREHPPQKRVFLNFYYRDRPVQDLDYTYWLGDGFSGIYSASNGMGYALLDGVVATEFRHLRLSIEYQYANKAHLEPEVEMMIQNVSLPYFERAEMRVNIAEAAARPITTQVEDQAYKLIHAHAREYKDYYSTVEGIVNAIRRKQQDGIRDYFTPMGYSMYQKLVTNGEVTVLDSHMDTLRIMRVGNEVMVRSVPMLFAFHNNRERFIENVVFSINDDGKISGLSFSLSDIAINDILNKPAGFGTEEDKYFMIKFMENYKTAFALQRLDYLEAIFDENALIIVGNVLERSRELVENVAGMYGNLSNTEIEYIRLSKAEYMDRLRRIFRRNEFINIRFEDNQVRKTQHDDKVYGIQIAQHYYSSTYADKGYLFLMIDLNDSLNPIVYVRTWQPEKNPDGSIYGLEDFRF